MNDSWLEKELARQLAPVAAPESLWDRINHRQPEPRRRLPLERAFWPVLAAMALLSLVGVLRTLGADRDSEKLAEQELAAVAGTSRGFDFRPVSFEDTRKWVKAEANIDIDLPSGEPSVDHGAVRVLGVRLIQLRGLPVAAIDYSAGDGVATLFVSGKHAGPTENSQPSRHLVSSARSAGDAHFVSWNMRNETYTIAFPGVKNVHGACLLCHATTPG